MLADDLDIRVRPVGHLPVVRAIIDSLGIYDVIDEACPKHSQSHVSHADCVVTLVLNALCGRPALYRMDDWLDGLDLDVLLGQDIEARHFNDTRLGVTLDRLDQVGTDTLMARVATRYLARSDATFTVHHDTTSVSLFGAYDDETAEPRPMHGFSKDHRPDLKQLIYGLTLHGSAGIPLVASVSAGNTSDTTVARDHLSKLVSLLPEENEVTFVGDCKVVDARTVGRILRAGLHFVSLLPKTFSVRSELVAAAFEKQEDPSEWPLLAEKDGPRKSSAKLQWRGRSFVRPFRTVLEGVDASAGPESMEELRFLVVSSDGLRQSFDRGLDKKLERATKAVEKATKTANRRGFACEEDARAAGVVLASKAPLHQATITTSSTKELLKRAKRGRPAKGEERPTQTVWRIQVELSRDEVQIGRARQRGSCFVLISDWLEEEWDDKRILQEYRHQHMIEGHTGFRWLKGPAAVAPVFLKTPSRIRAMGFVLILALMVRNYIQATMRSELAVRKETLPHPFTKQPKARLTTEMALEHFSGVHTQVVTMGTESRRMPVKLRPPALKLLSLLDLDESIFSLRQPQRRKRRKGVGKTPGT